VSAFETYKSTTFRNTFCERKSLRINSRNYWGRNSQNVISSWWPWGWVDEDSQVIWLKILSDFFDIHCSFSSVGFKKDILVGFDRGIMIFLDMLSWGLDMETWYQAFFVQGSLNVERFRRVFVWIFRFNMILIKDLVLLWRIKQAKV